MRIKDVLLPAVAMTAVSLPTLALADQYRIRVRNSPAGANDVTLNFITDGQNMPMVGIASIDSWAPMGQVPSIAANGNSFTMTLQPPRLFGNNDFILYTFTANAKTLFNGGTWSFPNNMVPRGVNPNIPIDGATLSMVNTPGPGACVPMLCGLAAMLRRRRAKP
jgi:hypothetical protein